MKRIFAIPLALLMLVSSIGFTKNTHFCGGEAVKTTFSLGLNNPDCGMAMMEINCEPVPYKGDRFTKKPCCENQRQILQVDEKTEILSSSISINPVFVVSFFYAFVQALIFSDKRLVNNSDYSPPIPDKNILVLFQSYLI